jgi:hypothetical protein
VIKQILAAARDRNLSRFHRLREQLAEREVTEQEQCERDGELLPELLVHAVS